MLPPNQRAALSPAELPVISHAARIHSYCHWMRVVLCLTIWDAGLVITRMKSVSEGKREEKWGMIDIRGCEVDFYLFKLDFFKCGLELRAALNCTLQTFDFKTPLGVAGQTEAHFILFTAHCFCWFTPLVRGGVREVMVSLMAAAKHEKLNALWQADDSADMSFEMLTLPPSSYLRQNVSVTQAPVLFKVPPPRNIFPYVYWVVFYSHVCRFYICVKLCEICFLTSQTSCSRALLKREKKGNWLPFIFLCLPLSTQQSWLFCSIVCSFSRTWP